MLLSEAARLEVGTGAAGWAQDNSTAASGQPDVVVPKPLVASGPVPNPESPVLQSLAPGPDCLSRLAQRALFRIHVSEPPMSIGCFAVNHVEKCTLQRLGDR